ncbi:MAG: hypothetical protein ACMUHX_01275 [bacterium]
MDKKVYKKKRDMEKFFFKRQAVFRDLFVLTFIFALLAFGCNAKNTKKDNEQKTDETEEQGKTEQFSPIKVESMVDNSQVTVGDVITYTLCVDSIPEIKPKIPEMGSKIIGLRIIDMGAEGPKEEGGRKKWEKWYKLQADITGSYIIPHVQVLYEDPNGNQAEATAPQIFIEVKSVIKEGEETGDIRDIKPLQKIKYNLKFLYILVAVCVLLIILIIPGLWLYLRKRNREGIVEEPTPEEVAIKDLERLKSSEYLDQQDYRSFYFRLSEIFRVYMEKRFGFPAQESTTEELIPQIERLDLTRAQKDIVRLLARGEDLVKFARYNPNIEKAQEDWEETRRFIHATSQKQETEEG